MGGTKMKIILFFTLSLLVSCSSLNTKKKEKSDLNIITIPIEIVQDKLIKTYYLKDVEDIFDVRIIARDSLIQKCDSLFTEVDCVRIKYTLNESYEEVYLKYKILKEKEVVFSIERKSQKGELKIKNSDEEVLINLDFNFHLFGKCKSNQEICISLSGKYEYEILASLNEYKITKIKFEQNKE